MSEKRLDNAEEKLDCKKKYLYEYSVFWECNDGFKSQILDSDVVDLLNKQDEEIKELETKRKLLVQKKNRYFRLYNSSVAEVKARVDTLNKVCEYYLTEAQFKAETDPNQAVKEVINRILNTEVEM